eukprot:Nk52_evm10s553 gene=Nk52_evmTU10s553
MSSAAERIDGRSCPDGNKPGQQPSEQLSTVTRIKRLVRGHSSKDSMTYLREKSGGSSNSSIDTENSAGQQNIVGQGVSGAKPTTFHDLIAEKERDSQLLRTSSDPSTSVSCVSAQSVSTASLPQFHMHHDTGMDDRAERGVVEKTGQAEGEMPNDSRGNLKEKGEWVLGTGVSKGMKENDSAASIGEGAAATANENTSSLTSSMSSVASTASPSMSSPLVPPSAAELRRRRTTMPPTVAQRAGSLAKDFIEKASAEKPSTPVPDAKEVEASSFGEMLKDMEKMLGNPLKYAFVVACFLVWSPPSFLFGVFVGIALMVGIGLGGVVFLLHYYNQGPHAPGVGPNGDPFQKDGVKDPSTLWVELRTRKARSGETTTLASASGEGGEMGVDGIGDDEGEEGGQGEGPDRLGSSLARSESNNKRKGFFQSVTKGFITVATEWHGAKKHNGVQFYGTLRTNLLLLSKKDDKSRAIETTILLESCKVTLLPDNGEESIRFNHRYPICIEHQSRELWDGNCRKIYLFIRPSREKEIWYRSFMSALDFLDKDKLQERTTLLAEYFDYMSRLQRKSEKIRDYGLSWFNIFIGRVYWDMRTSRKIVTHIATRIQKSMDRINRPSYMGRIILVDLDIGHSLPLLTSIDTVASDERGVHADVNVDYSGSFLVTLETRIQLETKPEKEKPSRFNFRKWMNKIVNHVNETPLTLSVKLKSLKGKMLLHIAQPPTDRLWYGFYGAPEMVLEVKAVVGQKYIKMTKITDFLEKQVRKEIASVYVLPNMDDTRIVAMSDSDFMSVNLVQEIIKGMRPDPADVAVTPEATRRSSSLRSTTSLPGERIRSFSQPVELGSNSPDSLGSESKDFFDAFAELSADDSDI